MSSTPSPPFFLCYYFTYNHFCCLFIDLLVIFYKYFNVKKPRVPKVPRVSRHTANFMGQYVPIPGMGTVYVGTGAVWENPTRGLPVLNPSDIGHTVYVTVSQHVVYISGPT